MSLTPMNVFLHGNGTSEIKYLQDYTPLLSWVVGYSVEGCEIMIGATEIDVLIRCEYMASSSNEREMETCEAKVQSE